LRLALSLKRVDSALRRIVAIKVLAPQLATTPSARKRFERESHAAAAISHEHVVAIYAVDQFKGLPYLVMEYVSGVQRLGIRFRFESRQLLDQRARGAGYEWSHRAFELLRSDRIRTKWHLLSSRRNAGSRINSITGCDGAASH